MFLLVLLIVPSMGAGLSHFHTTAASSTAALVASIGRSAIISAAPGRADAENTFIVVGVPATAVRILSRSLDMPMGTTSYAAVPLGAGRWRLVNVEVPMVGRWGIEVQAQRNRSWIKVGEIAYQVPFTGRMNLAHTNPAN